MGKSWYRQDINNQHVAKLRFLGIFWGSGKRLLGVKMAVGGGKLFWPQNTIIEGRWR
jgi:hypothetical protein